MFGHHRNVADFAHRQTVHWATSFVEYKVSNLRIRGEFIQKEWEDGPVNVFGQRA